MIKNNNTIIKALVIDDNEVNALVLSNMLSLFQIQVDTAYCGKTAIKMAKKVNYDIIFVDHVMPIMNGIETTMIIRSFCKCMDSTSIYALTSNNNSDKEKAYIKAGANNIYEKPLSLMDLVSILKLRFPERDFILIDEETATLDSELELIKKILENITEIDFEIGMKYAVGNPDHFIQVLRVSLKDIHGSIQNINKSKKKNLIHELIINVHNLKSVFSNIGAKVLSEEAFAMETVMLQNDVDTIFLQLADFVLHIREFYLKLENAIRKYEAIKLPIVMKQEREYIPMTTKEYEQCIQNTIYYIKRYEYNFIINELEKLIHAEKTEIKKEFRKALEDVKVFNYDNALNRINKINENRKEKITEKQHYM